MLKLGLFGFKLPAAVRFKVFLILFHPDLIKYPLLDRKNDQTNCLKSSSIGNTISMTFTCRMPYPALPFVSAFLLGFPSAKIQRKFAASPVPLRGCALLDD